MRVACKNCDKVYNVADAQIPDTGRKVRCINCKNVWMQFLSKKTEPYSPYAEQPSQTPAMVALPQHQEPELIKKSIDEMFRPSELEQDLDDLSDISSNIEEDALPKAVPADEEDLGAGYVNKEEIKEASLGLNKNKEDDDSSDYESDYDEEDTQGLQQSHYPELSEDEEDSDGLGEVLVNPKEEDRIVNEVSDPKFASTDPGNLDQIDEPREDFLEKEVSHELLDDEKNPDFKDVMEPEPERFPKIRLKTAFVALLMIVLTVFLLGALFQEVLPQSVRKIYHVFGLYSMENVGIGDVSMNSVKGRDGGDALQFKGSIVNNSEQVRFLPNISLYVEDVNNRHLYKAKLKGAARFLAPHEEFKFNHLISPVPLGSETVKIKIGNTLEMLLY